jgi:hypothetical protein
MFGVPLKVLYPLTACTILLGACASSTPAKPLAPSTVVATSSETAPRVTWKDNSTTEQSFVIYRDTVSETQETVESLERLQEVPANTTSFTDTKASSDVRYVYYIAAENAGGESSKVRQGNEAVRLRPAFETVVGSATSSDWRFPGVLTAFLMLVNEDAAKPRSDVVVSVKGPEGWNNNNPYSFTAVLSEFGTDVVRILPTTPLVSGTYTLAATVNDETYETTSVVDTGLTLETSDITFSLKTSERSADLAWTPISGAVSYRTYVGLSDINISASETIEQSSAFQDLELLSGEYTGRVYAFNYDTTQAKPERPFGQFMVSFTESGNVETVAFTESTFTKIDPSARYLASDDNDSGKTASTLSLSTLGAQPGECVSLMRQGDFQVDINSPDLSGDLIAAFRSSSGFLNPGSLGNQNSEFTTPTAQGTATDIAEDFWVPARLIYVQVPEGATQLVFAADDVRNSDNTDPDSDFGVLYRKISCPGAALQLQNVELYPLK